MLKDYHDGRAAASLAERGCGVARGRARMIRSRTMKRLACLVLAAGLTAASAASAGEPAGERYPSDEGLRHYLAGRWLEQNGDLAAAGGEFARAAALDPGSSAILLHASEVAARSGESTRSLELARRVLERSPHDAHALWLEGAALFNMSRASEALQPLRDAVAADSTNTECLRTLAHVAETLDQVALTDSCYELIVQQDEDDAESWAGSRRPTAP